MVSCVKAYCPHTSLSSAHARSVSAFSSLGEQVLSFSLSPLSLLTDPQAQSNVQAPSAERSHHEFWKQKEEPSVCRLPKHMCVAVFKSQGPLSTSRRDPIKVLDADHSD